MVRNLADLSRWILDNPELKDEWGAVAWKSAFDACDSPGDWDEFQRLHGTEPFGIRVLQEYQRIDAHNQTLPRSKIHTPMGLVEID